MAPLEKGVHPDGGSLSRSVRAEEREKFFFYTDPIFEQKDVFFHRKDYPFEWKTFEDLKGLRVGITHVYHYRDDFEKVKKSGLFKVDVAHADELAFRKLLARRIDVFPLAKEIGYTMIRKEFSASQADLITHHKKPIRTSRYCLLINKKRKSNARLVDEFNKGLKKLKKSGQYDKYYDDFLNGGYETKK